MNYISLYEKAGNKRDGNGGMHIPVFTCAQSFGERYARSVSFGLSRIFIMVNKSNEDIMEEVLQYLILVCAEKVAQENVTQIYDSIVMGLAYKTVSVFALSYKHRLYGTVLRPLGTRQRLRMGDMRQMASNIVLHARAAKTNSFCFWLDQILGQRMPRSERRWVDNGLLPYAVFDTIIFDYTEVEKGAWLLTERLLASGRRNTSTRRGCSRLIQRNAMEGGPDSMMRAASAIACGVIDKERGKPEDKLDIVKWSLETLDMSKFFQGNQVEHFTRLFYRREPWDKVRLFSVMFNLEILPGELVRAGSHLGWDQEMQLLSNLIPSDLRRCCDGSWLSRGITDVYATNKSDRFVYLQHFCRNARDSLLIVAVVSKPENVGDNRVFHYTAAAYDELTNSDATRIYRNRRPRIEWAPFQQFLENCGIISWILINQIHGKWTFSTRKPH